LDSAATIQCVLLCLNNSIRQPYWLIKITLFNIVKVIFNEDLLRKVFTLLIIDENLNIMVLFLKS